MKSQARAEANLKAKIAEAEGRLLCSKCQGDMLPNQEGVYEFENFRPGQGRAPGKMIGDFKKHNFCTVFFTYHRNRKKKCGEERVRIRSVLYSHQKNYT